MQSLGLFNIFGYEPYAQHHVVKIDMYKQKSDPTWTIYSNKHTFQMLRKV